MPRIARIVAKDCPHHITQRGNYQQAVFTKDSDYKFYIECLAEYHNKYNLSILAYCLMPNHVHFIAIPGSENSLAKTFNACHMRYAHYFNKKNNVKGHLWQGRFYSCILDDFHLYTAVRYIESNPVRANLVEKPWDWRWSSAREHTKNIKSSILALAPASKFMQIEDWESYLMQRDDEEVIKRIRANTLTGRPLGSEAFVDNLEKIFNRRLKALPRGRPNKD